MNNMNMTHLSVIVPAYNEEKNLERGALASIAEFLSEKEYMWEVLVVDDGSTDKSIELIDHFTKRHREFRLITNKHQGKAATVITGMLEATGEFVFFTDMDQATPINQLDKLLPYLEKEYDIVIGSRNRKREGAPLLRSLMGPGFMLLRTLILGLNGITDTQCGFKGFKKEVAQDIFSRLKLYGEKREVSGSHVSAGFDVEMLFIARRLGYKIKEVPVEWQYVDTRNVNPVKDSIEGLSDLIRIRLNELRGLYK